MQRYQWEISFPPISFQRIVSQVQAAALERARRIEIDLTYGDTVQDIWEGFRASTEPALATLELEKHFQAIRDGMRSANSEEWRGAMYECRHILEQLSDTLWQDEHTKKHPCLTNHKNEALDLGKDATKNRLMAYLHCNGTKDHEKQAVEAELEAVLASVPRLYNLSSTAHKREPVDRNVARLAVIQTYIFLGQLVHRTDLEPVTDADQCCKSPTADDAFVPVSARQ